MLLVQGPRWIREWVCHPGKEEKERREGEVYVNRASKETAVTVQWREDVVPWGWAQWRWGERERGEMLGSNILIDWILGVLEREDSLA